MITIQSIQVGVVRHEGDPGSRDIARRPWTTGFYKEPVSGEVPLAETGLRGDEVADTRNHGGPDKAVLCYPAAHYDAWRLELPDLPFVAGGFGENLTLEGVDEREVCLGDRYQLGEDGSPGGAGPILEVSQPRQPCWKISRRWGEKTLTKRVTQSGRTGWYVRVIQAGNLSAGESMRLIQRPHPEWSVARANDVMFGREVDRMAVIELMALAELAEAWKKDVA